MKTADGYILLILLRFRSRGLNELIESKLIESKLTESTVG